MGGSDGKVGPSYTWVQAILAEDDKERRSTLCNGAYSAFAHYNGMEAISILEMVLWKGELKRGWSNDGAQRQTVDQGELRCVCGSGVVIQHAVQFLGIPRAYLKCIDYIY